MSNFYNDSNINSKWKKIFAITLIVVIFSKWVMRKFIFKNEDSVIEDIIVLAVVVIGCVIIFRILWLYKNKPEKLR